MDEKNKQHRETTNAVKLTMRRQLHTMTEQMIETQTGVTELPPVEVRLACGFVTLADAVQNMGLAARLPPDDIKQAYRQIRRCVLEELGLPAGDDGDAQLPSKAHKSSDGFSIQLKDFVVSMASAFGFKPSQGRVAMEVMEQIQALQRSLHQEWHAADSELTCDQINDLLALAFATGASALSARNRQLGVEKTIEFTQQVVSLFPT